VTKELMSDIIHVCANLGYFSDIELGRFFRKVLTREIEKGKIKDKKKKS